MPILLCFSSKSRFSGALIQCRCLKPSLFFHPMLPVREHSFDKLFWRLGWADFSRPTAGQRDRKNCARCIWLPYSSYLVQRSQPSLSALDRDFTTGFGYYWGSSFRIGPFIFSGASRFVPGTAASGSTGYSGNLYGVESFQKLKSVTIFGFLARFHLSLLTQIVSWLLVRKTIHTRP